MAQQRTPMALYQAKASAIVGTAGSGSTSQAGTADSGDQYDASDSRSHPGISGCMVICPDTFDLRHGIEHCPRAGRRAADDDTSARERQANVSLTGMLSRDDGDVCTPLDF
jgi:hypothetical protein